MKENICLIVICVLITLAEAAEQYVLADSVQGQTPTDEINVRDANMPLELNNKNVEENVSKKKEQMQEMEEMQQMQQIYDMKLIQQMEQMQQMELMPKIEEKEDFIDPKEREDENNTESDISHDFLAAGDDFQNMAALTPANPDMIYSSGINTKHVIGYVPVATSNGQALIFPAGAIRIVQPTENANFEQDFVERAVKRQNNVKRNKRKKINRRRNSYQVYRRPENYYWQRRWPMALYGRRPANNKGRRYGNKQRVHNNY